MFPVDNTGNLIYMDLDTGQEYLMYGNKRLAILMRIPFVYQVPAVLGLDPATVSTPVQILVDSGSDFLWQEGVYQYDISAAAYTYETRPIPNYLVQINDSAAGRNLQNTPAPVQTWFGAVEKPIKRPLPYLFGAAATVQFTFTNFDAAQTNGNIRLSLIGQQIYYK